MPLVIILGTALLLVGFAYYAKAKGRSPVWCLVAFLSCIGLIILALLEDRAKGGVTPEAAPRPPHPETGNPFQS